MIAFDPGNAEHRRSLVDHCHVWKWIHDDSIYVWKLKDKRTTLKRHVRNTRKYYDSGLLLFESSSPSETSANLEWCDFWHPDFEQFCRNVGHVHKTIRPDHGPMHPFFNGVHHSWPLVAKGDVVWVHASFCERPTMYIHPMPVLNWCRNESELHERDRFWRQFNLRDWNMPYSHNGEIRERVADLVMNNRIDELLMEMKL